MECSRVVDCDSGGVRACLLALVKDHELTESSFRWQSGKEHACIRAQAEGRRADECLLLSTVCHEPYLSE
jgi:hypothetical protein